MGEGQGEGRDGFVGVAPASGKVTGEEFVLFWDVSGPDADDEAPPREVVDGRELLRGTQRMALGQNQHVGEQVGPVVCAASQPKVAVVSYQVVPMASASRSGMAVWSQTPR